MTVQSHLIVNERINGNALIWQVMVVVFLKPWKDESMWNFPIESHLMRSCMVYKYCSTFFIYLVVNKLKLLVFFMVLKVWWGGPLSHCILISRGNGLNEGFYVHFRTGFIIQMKWMRTFLISGVLYCTSKKLIRVIYHSQQNTN